MKTLTAAFTLFVGFASVASAQSLYGTLTGTVTDDSGAVVARAAITATQTETNSSRNTQTSETGGYNIQNLLPGTYQITITLAGFQTFNERNVRIEANQAIRLDAQMKVGQVSEEVTVSATAVALQTETAAVQSNTTSEQLVNLPTSGHSWQTTAAMMPGVAQPDYIQSGGSNNPTRALGISVNGQPTSNTVVRLDGVTQLNQYFQGIQAYTPGMEAIETVSLVTNSFDADQGMAGAAAVNVQVKSGTNRMSGSAFEHATDYSMKAANFFLPPGYPKGDGSTHIYGGTLGGPIKKDKLFYFASVERTRQRAYAGNPLSNIGANGLLSVPTAALRTGDFTGTNTVLYDPSTGTSSGTGRTPFANNAIPPSRISPVSSALLRDIVLPTLPGFNNNYFSTINYITDYSKYDGKLTWVAGSNTTINGRFGFATSYELGSGLLPATDPKCTKLSGAPFCANPIQAGRIWDTTVQSDSVAITHVVSTSFVVDGVFGYTTSDMVAVPDSPNCWGDTYGIKNSCQPPYSKSTAIPAITASTWTLTGGGQPRNYVDPQWGGAANASWMKSGHNIKFGGELKRLMQNHYENQTPTFNFTGGRTALAPAAPNNFNAFGDFLLGDMYQRTSEVMTPRIGETLTPQNNADFRPATLRGWQYGAYVRDQFQLTRKMTVSAGVRYEYYPLISRADRGLEVFNFTTNLLDICGVAGVPSSCGVTVEKTLFSPRLGWSYRLNDTTVIRAGFSRNPENGNSATSQMPPSQSFPVTIILTETGANNYAPIGNLSDGVSLVPQFNLGVGHVKPNAGLTTYRGQYVRGKITSFNVSIQKLLPHNLNLTLGYVANRQNGMTRTQNLNYGTLGGGTASQPYSAILGTAAAINVQSNLGHVQYDSFQANLVRRFSNGFQYTLAYTFAKAVDWWAGTIPQPQYWALNKGVASSNTPHLFNGTFAYELPFGSGKAYLSQRGVVSHILGGWQINGFLNARTGLPFTVTSSAGSLNAGTGTNQRADLVKSNVEILGGIGSTQPYFDVTAFRPVTAVRFGNAGFNQLYGPFIVNLDASLFRSFRIKERASVQLRIEGLNATNTPHFANPSTNVSDLQLNPDGSIRNLNGFGVITSTVRTGRQYDEREIRLSARFSF